MFTTVTINGQDYKLKLKASACIDLERKLKTNPVNILRKIADEGELPSLEDLLTILQCSLQAYHHGYDMNKTCDLYDQFIDDGHTMVDLIPIMIDVFKASGLIKETPEEEEEKN